MPVQNAAEPIAGISADQAASWEVEVFFDGDCPLCKREIAMLRRQDSRQAIRFTDISDFRFDSEAIGIPHSTLMAEIHGRLPDGSIIRGVEVFRHLYGAIGFQRLVRITRLPLVAPLLEIAYRCFAKIRLRLPGRSCDDKCYRK